MKITKEQLIEQIIEHSQLTREVVENELNQFIEESSGVVKGSPLTIEEMGVFRLKKGRLSFETDPKLALEINYKYAGMLPIEVKKGQTNSSQDDEIEDEEQVVSAKTENEDNEKVQIGKVREPKKEEPVKIKIEPITETAPIKEIKEEVVLITSVESEKETVVPIPSVEDEKTTATKSEKSAQEKSEPKLEKVAEVKKASPKSTPPKKQNDHTMTYATIVAAIIIIAAIVWFMKTKPTEVMQPIAEISKVKPEANADVKTEMKPEIKAEKAVASEKKMMDQSQQENPLKETKEQFQGKSDGVYKEGLKDINIKASSKTKLDPKKEEIVKDIVNQLQENGNPVVAKELKVYYTAVIYTLSFQSRAQQEVASLKKKGFSAFVKAFKNRNNEDRFYVCIGKLESYKDAKEFAETKLPEPYNSPKNFAVKRLTD